MKLTDYMKACELTESEMASRIGVSQSYFNRLKHGHVWPSREILAALARATDGLVTPNDLLEHDPLVHVREEAGQ